MAVPYKEVCEVIMDAISGKTSVRLAQEKTWDETYAGDVSFYFGTWVLTFFNDCDGLDYLDSAISTDGDEGEFDDWVREYAEEQGDEMAVFNPIDLLPEGDRDTLELLLKNAEAYL